MASVRLAEVATYEAREPDGDARLADVARELSGQLHMRAEELYPWAQVESDSIPPF
jgi:hypothetical protein